MNEINLLNFNLSVVFLSHMVKKKAVPYSRIPDNKLKLLQFGHIIIILKIIIIK